MLIIVCYIDECNEMTCDGNRKCVNADGSFECVCAEGYREGGINCIDIDECLDGDACDENLLEAHRQELKLQPQMKLVLIRQLQLRVPALQLRALQLPALQLRRQLIRRHQLPRQKRLFEQLQHYPPLPQKK